MIIGIAGKAGSGKNTVADYLTDNYGFKQVSFAETLKNMLSSAGFPEPKNREDKESIIKGFDFSWRYMAQTLGTEWGRSCLGEDIWVKMAMKRLTYDLDYVFSDVRFENEALAIRKNGLILHLVGREVDLGDNSRHVSENKLSVEDVDYEISNIGTKESLFECVDKALFMFKGNTFKKLSVTN